MGPQRHPPDGWLAVEQVEEGRGLPMTLISVLLATGATILAAVFITPWGNGFNFVLVWLVFFGLSYVTLVGHRAQEKSQQVELRQRYQELLSRQEGSSEWLVRHMVTVSALIAIVVVAVGLYLFTRFM